MEPEQSAQKSSWNQQISHQWLINIQDLISLTIPNYIKCRQWMKCFFSRRSNIFDEGVDKHIKGNVM